MNIREATLGDARAWDAFVLAHPAGSFFHLMGWRKALEKAYSHRASYLVADEEGDICGVLPLFSLRSLFFGRSLVSTPMAVEGGVLANDASIAEALLIKASERAQSLKVGQMELRSVTAQHGSWPVREGEHALFRREIGKDAEEILLSVPRKQRAVIRKSLQNDLEVDIVDDIDRFFALYARSVRDLGTPVFSRKWFSALKQLFGTQCEISIIRQGDTDVASLMTFFFKDRVLPYYAGSAPQARGLGAHDFMYYSLMCRSVEQGYTAFDFGRSKVGSGPYAYKKNWGFEPTPLEYQYYLPKGGELAPPRAEQGGFGLASSVWKKLPLPVANLLGPMVSGYLG